MSGGGEEPPTIVKAEELKAPEPIRPSEEAKKAEAGDPGGAKPAEAVAGKETAPKASAAKKKKAKEAAPAEKEGSAGGGTSEA